MSFCDCDTPAKNFGTPSCTGVLERAEKLCFVPMTDDQGTANAILLADVVDDTYVTGMINTGDKTGVATSRDNSKIWTPTGVISLVNNTRAENNSQDVDGFQINVSKGVKTVSFTIIDGANPRMAAAFESYGCRDSGFYQWSVVGQIGGNGKVANELRPFKIKKNTMKVVYNEPNKVNNTNAMITVSFDLAESEQDRDIAYMNYGTDTGDVLVDINSYVGLIDVTMEAATNKTTTGFTSTMVFPYYGAVFSKEAWTGGLPADFTLFNETTVAAVTILTAPESPDGTYSFTFALQTAADVLTLTLFKESYQPTGTLSIII